MECEEEPPSHFPQCPSGSVMGGRNVDESSNKRVELTLGVKTSKPRMSLELSSRFCEDSEACVAHHRGDDDHEDDSDDDHGPVSVYAPGKDTERGEDKGAAAAQAHSTKPKARTLVACRQLIDGNEAAALRDRSPLQLLTLTGTVSTDHSGTSSVHATITGKASVSAAPQDDTLRNITTNITREGKSQYYKELWLQVEERKQQIERERRRNAVDEQKHNETMQNSIWGMPGSGAPNYHLGTAKRTNSLHIAGILPQEQIRDKGFSGTPFHRL